MSSIWPPSATSGTNSTPAGLVAGRYRITNLLGEGGFGKVYAAEDTKFQPAKKVALKILDQQVISTTEVREAIIRETGALAQFNHPNILRVIDFDITPTLAYMVTELAEGGSLATKMHPDPAKPGVALKGKEIAFYLEYIADALNEAHEQGFIHRDIKPQNILLDRRGRPLLADFGIVVKLNNSVSVKTLTAVMGTPEYVAPEVWDDKITKATDIYALGVMLYQMLTGVPPFEGTVNQLMKQHLLDPIPPLRSKLAASFPLALDEVMVKAMAKDPQHRYKNATELYCAFVDALGSFAGASSSVISTKSASPQAQPISSLAPTQVSPSPGYLQIKQPLFVLRGHTGPVNSVAFHSNGKVLASGGDDGKIRLWDVASGKELRTLTGKSAVWKVEFSNDSRTLLSYHLNESIEYWEFSSGNRLRTVAKEHSWDSDWLPWARSAVFSPDGETLAYTNLSGSIKLLRMHKNPSYRGDRKLWLLQWCEDIGVIQSHSSSVKSLSYSPDGKILASGSFDKTIKLWSVPSGKNLATFTGHSDRVWSVVFSPDGSAVVSGCFDGTVKVWKIDSGKELFTFSSGSEPVNALAVSPNGKIIATGSDDGLVKLW